MSGHQEWLEAPYTNAARREAEYDEWLERNPQLDPEDDHWDAFEEWVAEQQPDDFDYYEDEEQE